MSNDPFLCALKCMIGLIAGKIHIRPKRPKREKADMLNNAAYKSWNLSHPSYLTWKVARNFARFLRIFICLQWKIWNLENHFTVSKFKLLSPYFTQKSKEQSLSAIFFVHEKAWANFGLCRISDRVIFCVWQIDRLRKKNETAKQKYPPKNNFK